MKKEEKYSLRSKSLYLKLYQFRDKILDQLSHKCNEEGEMETDRISDELIDDLLATADKIRHIEKLEKEKLVPRRL